MNFEFIDLDHYIEKQLQESIDSIFKTKGEIYFRKMERHFLEEVLNTNSSLILFFVSLIISCKTEKGKY